MLLVKYAFIKKMVKNKKGCHRMPPLPWQKGGAEKEMALGARFPKLRGEPYYQWD